MDILEFAQKSSESEVEQSLQFNHQKLAKLETRQRRAAHTQEYKRKSSILMIDVET